MTRQEAESLCREVVSIYFGGPLPENIIQESVAMLLRTVEADEAEEEG